MRGFGYSWQIKKETEKKSGNNEKKKGREMRRRRRKGDRRREADKRLDPVREEKKENPELVKIG